MEEIWKNVPGYEERYQVSNYGNLRSKDMVLHKSNGVVEYRKGRLIKLQTNPQGYYVYPLSHPSLKKRKLTLIHRIVAKAFIPNPENKPCIDHINRCRTDNRVENLRWCTLKENMNNPNTIAHLKVCRPDFKHSIETRKKLSEIQIGKIIPVSTRMKIRERGVPVSQYSKNGQFIRHHRSASYASEELNIPHQHIRQCCRGIRKSTGGFRWIYKSEHQDGLNLSPLTYNRPKELIYKKNGKSK